MLTQMFKKKKELRLERTYPAPVAAVWKAWTDADALRQWWGPDKTVVPECEVDLRVGGRLYVVTEAGEGMGKYKGTRWPMEATISLIEENRRLVCECRSWTEGEEDTSTIEHVNDLTLTEVDGETKLVLAITITRIGSKAKLASFGMKMGYKSQLDKLAELLAGS